eukprot:7260434-Alexandrium_andersonii.AAC.1
MAAIAMVGGGGRGKGATLASSGRLRKRGDVRRVTAAPSQRCVDRPACRAPARACWCPSPPAPGG